jgi:hypothetical protein
MEPVVAEGVDVPPEITTLCDRLVESRCAISVAAAKRPDMAAIGTPGPGCTLPPARYRPGSALVAEGFLNADIQPCVAGPYSAPPVAGKRRLKSAGVVRTTWWGWA